MPAPLGLTPLKKALLMRHALRPNLRSYLLGAVLALPCAAQVQAQQANFDIPAQSLGNALQTFGQQADLQVLYNQDSVQGKRSTAIKGSLQPDQALTQLLQGTGVTYQRQGNTVTLGQSGGSVQLGTTNISTQGLGSTTEGTGSYTTGQSNSATRLDLSLRETPQSVSVITRQQMDDQGLTELAQVMQQTPGITVNRESSEGYVYYSRGFEIQNFQYDGIPSLGTDGGNIRDNYSIGNTLIYDRIEVLKGATGLVNGIGYPSGVINMVRKRPTREFQGHIAAGAGSWDRYTSEVDVSGPLVEGGAIRGRMVAGTGKRNSFIDYQKGEQNVFYGILEGDLSDSTTLSVGYDYQKNNNDATTNTSLPVFYKNGNRIKFSRSTNPADKYAYRNQETQHAFVGLDHQFDNDWTFKATVNARKYTSREIIAGMSSEHVNLDNSQDYGYLPPGGVTNFDSNSDEKSFDAYAKGPFALFGRTHELVFGYNYSHATTMSKRTDGTSSSTIDNVLNWNNSEPYPTDWAWWSTFDVKSTQKVSYAAVILKPTDALNFILGARVNDYDWQIDRVNALRQLPRISTTNSGEVIPYAGVTYDLDDHHTVYASYTDIFKPQPYNLGADGKPLDPLTGQSYEVGIKGEYFDRRLNASMALFQLKQDNLAESSGVMGVDGFEAMRAIKGATTNGVELEMAGEVLPDWNVNAGYVYQESYDAKNKRVATTQPQHLFKVATTYRLPAELNKVTVGGNMQWQSATSFVDDTFTDAAYNPLPSHKFTRSSYAVVGLMSSYDFNQNLKATVNLNNVFDRTYYSGIGTYNSIYYGDPRNVMFNVKYSF